MALIRSGMLFLFSKQELLKISNLSFVKFLFFIVSKSTDVQKQLVDSFRY